MILYDPILVVGSARCGTSMVASILYNLGVFMGNTFVAPNSTNVYGHWEDKEFHDLNVSFIGGSITEYQWRFGIEKLIIDRRSRMTAWGFKDPRIAELLPFYLSYFKNPVFIWCKRKHEDIEKSMKKAYGWEKDISEKIINVRENSIKKHTESHKVLEVQFSQLLSDKEKQVERVFRFINQEHLKNAVNFIQGE